MARIGFIGLGVMGQGMVKNLVSAGHSVTVWNRSPEPTKVARDHGATVAPTLSDAVRNAEVVMYCLADDAAIEAVVLGDGGITSLVTATQIVIDLTTVSPETTKRQAAAFTASSVTFLDAPVFGSRGEANSGGLWVVVGGPNDAVQQVRPILESISASIHHMGPTGSGAAMKLVGNLVVAAQLEALGESLTLAKTAGLSISDVLEVFAATDFRSPIFDGVGASVLVGDYSANFALHLMLKDARLVVRFAERLGVSIPATTATLGTIERAVEAGFGDENASALIKVLARDAGVDLAD
jgi:3-hydroxyisobutyrate dehydrogenase-like beta-hydroxyacid dehydrogenase